MSNREEEIFKYVLKDTVKEILDELLRTKVIEVIDEKKYEVILNNLKNKPIN